MKKMIISVVILLMCGTVFAQHPAPENLGIRSAYLTGQCVQVSFFCDLIDDPDLDRYDMYFDGDFIISLSSDIFGADEVYCYYEFEEMEFISNEYHTATVVAQYTDSESDTSSINFYLSETHYAVPDDITVTHNFEECTSLIEWDEPADGGSGAPLIVDYEIYLDGVYVGNTQELYFYLDNMIYEQSYIVGIAVNYSDGHSSLTFHPMLRKEMYFFAEFEPPEEIAIDESTGTLNWHIPGDGDVIGGTIMHMLCPMLWAQWWAYIWPPPGDAWYFGDGNNQVGLRWGFAGWIHNCLPEDMEAMWVEEGPQDTDYGTTDATAITQITDASSLVFSDYTLLYDADTSRDGYGDFVVLKNNETDYYGAFQVLDVYECTLCQTMPALLYNCNWWFQTNGSDDFSSASRYYPLYYNIYLDGVYVDSVNYELVICVDGEPVLVDSTLTPGSALTPPAEFEYQFENLVNGQSYTAGIEAVYKVGSSGIETLDFTYNGISVDDPQTGASRPILSNYPNPFRQHTNISFSIPQSGHVMLDVYNIKGEKVKTLVDETLEATDYNIEWNGTDNAGKSVASGVYLYRMSLNGKNIISNKMILMK